MESNNSQFEEVPADEATEAAASKTPKKKRRPTDEPAPLRAQQVEAPPAQEELPETPEAKANREKEEAVARVLVRTGTPENRIGAKYQEELAKIDRQTKANKRRHKIYDTTEPEQEAGTAPEVAPEVEHKAGLHGPLTGSDPANLEDLADLSYSDAIRISGHTDHCPVCAENHRNYVEQILPVHHDSGLHRDALKAKEKGLNYVGSCQGCRDEAAQIATSGHKKAKHSKYIGALRKVFGRNGCPECEKDHDTMLHEEHMDGSHAGEENRRPACKACQEIQAKEDEAAVINEPQKARKAASRLRRTRQLRLVGLTGSLDPLDAPPEEHGVTDSLIQDGSIVRTVTEARAGQDYSVTHEHVPSWFDQQTMGPLHEDDKAWLAKWAEDRNEKKMWDDVYAKDFGGRPNYKGFRLPSVTALAPTEKRRGRTAGATPDEMSEFQGLTGPDMPVPGPGGAGSGTQSNPGTKKYIPEHLHPLFVESEVIPSLSEQREAAANPKPPSQAELSRRASAVGGSVYSWHGRHSVPAEQRPAITKQTTKHSDIVKGISRAGLQNVFDTYKDNDRAQHVLYHLAEHPEIQSAENGGVAKSLEQHFTAKADTEGLSRLRGTHPQPFSSVEESGATVDDYAKTPRPEPINTWPTPLQDPLVSQSTAPEVACSDCGKAMRLVAGNVDPYTNRVPDAKCRSCMRKSAETRVAAEGITPYVRAAHARGDHEGNSVANCPDCQ
jgi:hypothetical protein